MHNAIALGHYKSQRTRRREVRAPPFRHPRLERAVRGAPRGHGRDPAESFAREVAGRV